VPFVLKSESLNLLEPSGPVQACNGIALPFTRPENLDLRWFHTYFSYGHFVDVSGQIKIPVALTPGEGLTRYALHATSSGPQARCGRGTELQRNALQNAVKLK
jgi:hypothetical protein